MRKAIYTAQKVFLAITSVLWSQNIGQMSATEAQLSQKMLRQQAANEQILQDEK